MLSFSPRSLAALVSFVCMLDIGQAATIPKARAGASIGQGMPMTGMVLSSSSPPLSIEDFQDTIYLVDIVLGGQQLKVVMDTGSADLWVQPSSTQTLQLSGKSTLTAEEAFGIGNMTGDIAFAELQLDGFTVPSQAFLLATSVNDISVVELNLGAGFMGLSFEDSDFSPINNQIRKGTNDPTSTVGASPIFNILSQNPTSSSSFDLQLQRVSDLDNTAQGTLIIGSHVAGFENVTAQPRLPRVTTGRWSVASDGMAVNGKSFQFNQSSVSGLASGQIAAVLDSGFSLPPLPPAAVDFIYSSIPGAVSYPTDNFQWIIPCNGTTNVTFTFGGVDFPVHYLDLTTLSSVNLTIDGKLTNVTYCFNTFQNLTLGSNFAGFDVVLGDAFLRNVYASFNYGDITATDEDQSFVQLVSTTDLNTALPDFKTSRTKTLASLGPELAPADFVKYMQQPGNSPSSGGPSGSSSPGSSSPGSSKPNSSSSLYIKLHSLVTVYGLVVLAILTGSIVVGF